MCRITAILVSRFLLHLQCANRKALNMSSVDDTRADATPSSGTVIFERVVGSLSSFVSFGPEEDDEDDDNVTANDSESSKTASPEKQGSEPMV